jgi:hypothetical protein
LCCRRLGAPLPSGNSRERLFPSEVGTLPVGAADVLQAGTASPMTRRDQSGRAAVRKARPRSKTIDKSELTLPEPRRIRDRNHVRSVAKRPCLICGRQPSDAHHLRFAQRRALGRKVSDELTVPLCRGHHREVHRCGDEPAWWRRAGLTQPVLRARCGLRRIIETRNTSKRQLGSFVLAGTRSDS